MESSEKSVTIKDLYRIVMKHIKLIIAVTVLTGLIGFILSAFVIEKQYTAQSLLYVDARSSVSSGTDETNIDYNDIMASDKLVNTCQILFTSDAMLDLIISDLETNNGITYLSRDEISDMITVTSENETSTMSINVVSNDPQLSATVANIIRDRANEVYQSIVGSGVVKTVTTAGIPERASFPDIKIFTAGGLLIGFLISAAAVLLFELYNTKIKVSDDLFEMYGIPVLADISDIHSGVKKGYGYEYK